MTYADALRDEHVLVPSQLALELFRHLLVLKLFAIDPGRVGRGERAARVNLVHELGEAEVRLGVLAGLGFGDGDAKTFECEWWAEAGDVIEADQACESWTVSVWHVVSCGRTFIVGNVAFQVEARNVWTISMQTRCVRETCL